MTDISKEIGAQVSSAGFSSEEYNDFARSVELEGIVLMKSEFDVKPECIPEKDDWKLSHGRKILACHYTEEEQGVASIIEFNVIAKLGRKHALKCIAQYVAFYATPANAREETAMAYCRNVAIFAAYPYFRALVSRLSSEANIDLPTLPAIASTAHIPPKKAKKRQTVDKANTK